MKPAIAKTTDANAVEELGRATLQIVHDLKNQLNGLKLYATFLRKRLEREERSSEERETLQKLIAGLDRAARDMTGLVRYAQPLALCCQPGIDLRTVISGAVRESTARQGADFPLHCEIESEPLIGEFDVAALSEALKALTEEALNSVAARDECKVSLRAHRERTSGSSEAIIEWRGVRLSARNHPFRTSDSHGTVHTAQAARIIEAHGGRFQCDSETMRAWLPLSV